MRAKGMLVLAILVAATLAVVVVTLAMLRPWEQPAVAEPDRPSPAAAKVPLVDDSTYVLDDAGEGAPVVVEFLDFECEACGFVYPTMEELREQYEGDVTFAVRFFPLPSHPNGVPAALAAEAAGQQGQFEAMYQTLFERQDEWMLQNDAAERFRGYAEDLGLDLAAYDAAVASPATLDRVQFDMEAGETLGVAQTPTIFVDGEQLQIERLGDIENGIAEAVASAE